MKHEVGINMKENALNDCKVHTLTLWKITSLKWYAGRRFRVPLQVLSTHLNHNRRDMQNNYMEGSGSATKNKAAHPKYAEEVETSPNRNHIITSKIADKLALSFPTAVNDTLQFI